MQLQDALKEARKFTACSMFRLETIKDKDELVRVYTGFPDYVTLTLVLESDAKLMRQWDSRRCGEHMMLNMAHHASSLC